MCRATNLRTGEVIAEHVFVATTFLQRLRGLLGRKGLLSGEGLYIPHCSSIHTFFMQFPIDVVFLGNECEVTRLVESLAPFRLAAGPRGTAAVLELKSGTLARAVCRNGDTVCLEQ